MADDFDPYYTWLGIRPEEQPPDHYRLIGLRQFESNADVIANATDRQMQFLRSMQVGKRSAQSQALLNEISAAGGCLLDPQRKAKYDQELRAKEATKAQATKTAAAKAKPLPKATALEPTPKNDIISVQVAAAPATASHAAAATAVTPAKAAAKASLVPVLVAGGIGAALVLISLVAGIGYMVAGGGGGKKSAANVPAKAPQYAPVVSPNVAPSIPIAPAVSPSKPPSPSTPEDPANNKPISEQKTASPKTAAPNESAKTPAPELPATAVASPTEPPRSNWQPPGANSNEAFRSMLGTYMFWLDRAKPYPIVNLQVPNKNLVPKEIQDKSTGQSMYEEISYVGTAKILIPQDKAFVLDTVPEARVIIDGVTISDFNTPKGEIGISKGLHDFTFEIHSHGQPYVQHCHLALRDKESGEEVVFFNTWQDIQKLLGTTLQGQRVNEISGWQPTEASELKNYDQLLASAGVKRPGDSGPSGPRETASPAVARIAVPEAAALEKARKQLVDVFGDEGRGATTPEKKVELAKKMLQVEAESKSDPALQYALLDNARKLFAAAGEAEFALAAVDTLGERFELDPWPLKTETATTISDVNVTPTARDQIAGRLLTATDEAIGAQKFAAAEDFARLAAKVSAKGRDVDLRKSINQKRTDLSRLKQHFAKVEEARAKLKTTADDAEANLVVGKFTALGLVDFDAGIPYLAKSGQGLYSAAAAADALAAKGEKGAALSAADAWYKLAESIKGEDKSASTVAQRRARDWYEVSAGEVQGLEKVRIERRLKELQGLATTLRAAPAPRTASGGSPAESGRNKPADQAKGVAGFVGRGYSNGKDANLFFTYHPGHKLTRDEIQELQKNLGTENSRVEFLTTLSLTADADVSFHHVGGSSNRGVHHLLLDGKEIHAVGDDRNKDETLIMHVGRGQHLLSWVLTGGDLGNAQLEIKLANTGNQDAKLEILAPADMVAFARSIGAKQEFVYGTPPQAAPVTAAKPAPKGPEKVGRTNPRRPGARVPGKFDAVAVAPGAVSGRGSRLVSGWEFKLKENVQVTELGIYDHDQNGLGEAHEVAIWDVENQKEPVVKATIPAGEEGTLVGTFRCVSVDRVELQAGRRYAIVAHFANLVDTSVSLLNSDGLSVAYAPIIEVLGRRFAFPKDAMAFPSGSADEPRQADIGPTFRFDVVVEKKKKVAEKKEN